MYCIRVAVPDHDGSLPLIHALPHEKLRKITERMRRAGPPALRSQATPPRVPLSYLARFDYVRERAPCRPVSGLVSGFARLPVPWEQWRLELNPGAPPFQPTKSPPDLPLRGQLRSCREHLATHRLPVSPAAQEARSGHLQ